MFTFSVKVYYEDTDLVGIVYHANYLKYLERARTELFAELGFSLTTLKQQHDMQFVLRQLQIEYLTPARFNDLLTVNTQVVAIKGPSIYFVQEVVNAAMVARKLVTANVKVVCLNGDFKPKKIPDFLQQELI